MVIKSTIRRFAETRNAKSHTYGTYGDNPCKVLFKQGLDTQFPEVEEKQ